MAEARRSDVSERAATAEETDLAVTLATFVKASFLYPDSHSRVVDARSTFLTRLGTYGRTHDGFELRNGSDAMQTPTGRIATQSPVLTWFRSQLEKTLLRTLRFAIDVPAASLQSFAARLRETVSQRAPKDAAFGWFWPSPIDGITLGEFRFDGGFHSVDVRDTSDGSVRAAVALPFRSSHVDLRALGVANDTIERIRDLENSLTRKVLAFDDGVEFDLARELMAALPGDVVSDPNAARGFLDAVLDRFETSAPRAVRGDAGDIERMLGMFREVANTFFASAERTATPAVRTPLALADERNAGALAATIDPVGVVDAILALPDTSIDLAGDPVDAASELLAVLLHRLANCASDAEADAPATRACVAFDVCGEAALRIVEPYIRMVLDANVEPNSARGAARVLAHLGNRGLLGRLRTGGALSAARVATAFPRGFLLYLESCERTDGAEFAAMVRSIDERTLAAGIEALTGRDGIAASDRLRKLFDLAGRDALPFARALLRVGDPNVRDAIVAFLRRLDDGRAEGAPLRLGHRFEPLPEWYLDAICELERTGKPGRTLRDQVGTFLRGHLESLAPETASEEQRVEAILALQAYPGPASQVLLERQLRGEGWLGRRRVPASVRQAVDEVRAAWRGRRHV